MKPEKEISAERVKTIISNKHKFGNFAEVLQALVDNKLTYLETNEIVDEAMEQYHTAKLNEVSGELPNNVEINKKAQQEYPTTTLDGTFIMGANWMKQKAIPVINQYKLSQRILDNTNDTLTKTINILKASLEEKEKEIAGLNRKLNPKRADDCSICGAVLYSYQFECPNCKNINPYYEK